MENEILIPTSKTFFELQLAKSDLLGRKISKLVFTTCKKTELNDLD
jgi:hypothetical protein